MITIERGPQHLALHAGSTTVALDKVAGKAVLQRKLLLWARKPVERPLSSVKEVRINADVDPASRAEIYSAMLLMKEGDGWVLSARDKQDATKALEALREFLGVTG
jgi:hypothetical protein